MSANYSDEQLDEVLNRISKWLDLFMKSNHFKPLTQKENVKFIIQTFADIMYAYYGLLPEEWTETGLENCCLYLIPEKVSADEPYFRSVAPVLAAFFSFLEKENLLKNLSKLRKKVLELDEQIVLNAKDPRNWGYAKSSTMAARAAGVDIMNDNEVKAFYAMLNKVEQPADFILRELFNLNMKERFAQHEPDLVSKMVELICDNEILRNIATKVLTQEINEIAESSKYRLEEIHTHIYDLLYYLFYLGIAIKEILKSQKVSKENKKFLAKSYLQILQPYGSNILPTLDNFFKDPGPVYTLEMTVFLAGIDEFNVWSDYELVGSIISHGDKSEPETKEKFLELLITQLNKDQALVAYLSKFPPISQRNIFSLMQVPDTSPNSSLLIALSPLLTHPTRYVSFEPLGKLQLLTQQDIRWVINHLSFFNSSNSVKASEDIYEILLKKGENMTDLLTQLFSEGKKKGFPYYFNNKIKGILAIINNQLPKDQRKHIPIIRKFLALNPPAPLRLTLYKVLYTATKEKELLEKAAKDGAKPIRNWSRKKLKNN